MKKRSIAHITSFVLTIGLMTGCGKEEPTPRGRLHGDTNSSIMAPLPEILNATPTDARYQFIDTIYDRAYWDGELAYIELGYGEQLEWYWQEDSLAGLNTVGDIMGELEYRSSVPITWVDYNPVRLDPEQLDTYDHYFTSDLDFEDNYIYYKNPFVWDDYNPEKSVSDQLGTRDCEYILGTDSEGNRLYCIWASNHSGETKALKDCSGIEIYHDLWNIDFDFSPIYREREPDFDHYAYFFNGINVFSGEWTYSKVIDTITDYPYVGMEEERFYSYFWIYIGYELPYSYKAYELYDYDYEFLNTITEYGRIEYAFRFDSKTELLEHMEMRFTNEDGFYDPEKVIYDIGIPN